jgi:hypothetical protein
LQSVARLGQSHLGPDSGRQRGARNGFLPLWHEEFLLCRETFLAGAAARVGGSDLFPPVFFDRTGDRDLVSARIAGA